jgi:hypothetical protein
MPATPDQCRRYRARLRERALQLKGNVCCQCGLLWDLEFAHTDDTPVNGAGRGMDRRYRDVLKHPDCYVLMCHDCHLEFDRDIAPW